MSCKFEIGHFRLCLLPLVENESLRKTFLIIENEFDLHQNECADETHSHMKGFALGLVLTERQTQLENDLFQYLVYRTLKEFGKFAIIFLR